MNTELSVREIQESDIHFIIDYWLQADEEFLRAMGADIKKIPLKDQWMEMLMQQINQSYEEKESYCTIWLINEKPVGHCNVNEIIYGKEAYMHLHLWNTETRKKGAGTEFVKKSIIFFFKNLLLKSLYSEPYALNSAPNKVLEKTGFRFVKEYRTTPGYLNFEQNVKLWRLDLEQFSKV